MQKEHPPPLKEKKIKQSHQHSMFLFCILEDHILKVWRQANVQDVQSLPHSRGLGTQKSLYNKAKFVNYPMDEFRMKFYLKMMMTLICKRNTKFTIFEGTKPIYVVLVNSTFRDLEFKVSA